MKKTGFYIIKDKFFEDMPDPYLKGNKAGNRPHYYCFEDSSTGIYWVIPLSSRIDKYRRIMEKKEKAGKPCDILHIVKLDDSREIAFLIQDMFPITEEYIEREYTIAGNHLMLTSEHTVREIEQKARKVMGMLKHGIKFTPTQPDVTEILEKLGECKIFILGHSLAYIDFSYFQKIRESVLENCVWNITYHSEKDENNAKDFVKKLGIRDYQIKKFEAYSI